MVLVYHNHLQSIKACIYYYFARLAFYSILFVTGLITIPLFIFTPKNIKNSTQYTKCAGKHISRIYGISWEIRGNKHLAKDRGAVVVANHQHELDIVGMFIVWDILKKCTAVAKKELLWNPLGISAWLAGVVFIDRHNPESAKTKINRISWILRENKKIFIFPEGTRNREVKESRKLLPFKKGAFRIAIDAQVPVIPLVISPYYFIDDADKALKAGGRVILSALPAIPTVGLNKEHTENLMNFVRDKMQCEYESLCKELRECVDLNM